MTALHLTCQRGLLNIVSLSLLHGVNPDSMDDRYITPLHFACLLYKVKGWSSTSFIYGNNKNKNTDLIQHVRLLLAYGAYANVQNEYRETPLVKAVYSIGLKHKCSKIPDRGMMLIQVLLESHLNINDDLEET